MAAVEAHHVPYAYTVTSLLPTSDIPHSFRAIHVVHLKTQPHPFYKPCTHYRYSGAAYIMTLIIGSAPLHTFVLLTYFPAVIKGPPWWYAACFDREHSVGSVVAP